MAKMPKQKPGKSKQDYATPEEFIAAVKIKLGLGNRFHAFSIDLAANASNTKAVAWLGPGSEYPDALDKNLWWDHFIQDGDWGWLNPEFADIEPWAAKCCKTVRQKPGVHIAMLIPAAVGSNWWRDYVHNKSLVLLLNGRLCFIDDWQNTIDPSSVKKVKRGVLKQPHYYKSAPLYPKDCCLCLYGFGLKGYEVWPWKRGQTADSKRATQ